MSFFRLTPGVASSVFFRSFWHLVQTISGWYRWIMWGVGGLMESWKSPSMELCIICTNVCMILEAWKDGDGRSIFRS